MRVLLVEDEADLRKSLVAILEHRGYDVTALGTAQAALAAYREEHFPLVILDWGLPGRDGLWLCRQIRSLPDGDTSVVLVVTARARAEDLAAVLQAGASDYLAKPFDLEFLDVRLTVAEAHADQLARVLGKPVAIETLVGAIRDALA